MFSPGGSDRRENERFLRILAIKLDILRENPGISLEDASARAENYWDNLVSADQRKPFEEAARDKKRREATNEMIRKIANKVIPDDTLAVPEGSGPAARVDELRCSINQKDYVLPKDVRGEWVIAKFVRHERGLMFDDDENALIKHLRTILIDGRTSYSISCPVCKNPLGYFRLVAGPKKD